MSAYTNVWYKHFGPAGTLYTDGEGGLVSDAAKRDIARLGTTVIQKASGQHAHIIEARNGLCAESCTRLSQTVGGSA